MKALRKKVPSKGRGPYNAACDGCARRKIKCDGNKPLCQPCQSQGRQNECTWSKSPSRKPRTEAYVEAMHKRVENLRQLGAEYCHYIDYLESLLDEFQQKHPGTTIDFRASRPSGLLVQSDPLLDRDSDFTMMGGDDNGRSDQDSDDGKDPTVMAISIPPQSLQVEPFTQPSRFPALVENPDDIYVLMVDGVQQSHFNPAFDWSRHLPPYIGLDRQSHDRALDLLFKFSTSWCLCIMPDLFLRDMCRALSMPPSQTPPKTPHYSPMLHNALVALALALLEDSKFTDFKIRQCFANTAKSFIEAECRKPNLSVVHALSILATFHSSQGDQTLGYMYFGMSARMSQALGLDLDCSEWVKLGLMEESERIDRHWASLTNFTQDVCWSLYVGRDFCVAEPVDVPKENLMSHIDPGFDEMPWFYPPSGIAPQPNNLTKTFEATCRLLMIARRIMDVINGNKSRTRPLILDGLISDIDVQLNMWKSSLTAELEITPRSLLTATPHKLMLHLAYWWLFILLHRPFFHSKSRPIHSTDREIDHIKLSRRAAENIMELLSTWRTLYKLRYCPVALIQTVFSAGTVYLFTAKQAISGTRIAQKKLRHSWDQETLVLQYLEEIGMSWKCAANISDTLRNLMKEQVRPHLDRKCIPSPTAGLYIPGDIGDDEEENGYSSSWRSSQIRKRSSIRSRQVAHPDTRSSGFAQSSLSTSPNHTLSPPTASTQISPSLPQPLNSPTITISPARNAPSNYDTPSTPITIPQRSSSASPSSFPDSRGAGSSPNFSTNYSSSFVHRGSQGYPQPPNYIENPFSSNENGNSDDVGHAFGGQGSFLAHNFQLSSSPSSSDHYVGGYFGMLGGQTLSEMPFIGLFSEADIYNPHFSNSLQAPFGTGSLNCEPRSSLGEHVTSSQGDNDSMDLDNLNVPWDSFA